MKRRTAVIAYVAIAATIIALDLWTKSAAFEFLGAEVIPAQGEMRALQRPPHPREHVVIEGFFNLQTTLNYGAFSGMFAGQKWLLLGVSSLWVVGTLVFVLWQRQHDRWLLIGLALTAGGAVGNLYDRYFIGAVRDFIKWFVVIGGDEKVWPNFNIADAAICCGVVLILIQEFRRKPEPEPVPATPGPGSSDTDSTASDAHRSSDESVGSAK